MVDANAYFNSYRKELMHELIYKTIWPKNI